MSTTKAEPFPIAVVRPPSTEDGFITFSLSVYNGFNGNATFPSRRRSQGAPRRPPGPWHPCP
jgi:hypothetical protein